MKKDVKIFLNHILESIENIDSFSKNISKSEFMKEKLNQNAIVRELEIIGEASKNIPDDFRKEHSSINWKEIIGTRDKIIHHYFGVDLEIIWDIIKNDIPKLKAGIRNILKEL